MYMKFPTKSYLKQRSTKADWPYGPYRHSVLKPATVSKAAKTTREMAEI